MTDPVVEIGVALMRQGGMPEHIARQAMYEDPRCREVAQRLVPIFERLAEGITALMPALVDVTTDDGGAA